MAEETRRAHGSFELRTEDGGVRSGEGDLEITDDGLSVGDVSIDFLDADAFTDQDRVLTLGLWPRGDLKLSQLARRHDTFSAALAEARDRARVAGLLAHGIAAPTAFTGCTREPGQDVDSSLLLYATHLTVVPEGRDPFQIPFGAITAIRFEEAAWSIVVESAGGRFVFGQLARRTEMFARDLAAARDTQGKRLAAVAGSSVFGDGMGVPAGKIREFDRLLDAWTSPERAECAGEILKASDREAARIGLVELQDPDESALAARSPLPENLAAFLLSPVDGKVVLELLSGPSAATYVFRGGIDAINRDLQAMHFRRRALSLSENETKGAAGRPYRLALRKLEPLARLRAATAARIVHTEEGWSDSFRKAIG